jgi:hypothetical protein
LDRAYSR